MPSSGGLGARVLVVGLAPALRGGNRTGRPFVGDNSGLWLRAALARFGLGEDAVRITNAVRCVPPKNRPTGAEVATCRRFLVAEIGALPDLRAIVALGRIAHDATLGAFGLALRDHPFGHGAEHAVRPEMRLIDSYHPSPQNTHTGRLTRDMLDAVFARAESIVRASRPMSE